MKQISLATMGFELVTKRTCCYKTRSMKQTPLNLNLNLKKTRKGEFLGQIEQVVPWAALVELIAQYYPEGLTGRPPKTRKGTQSEPICSRFR